MQSRGNCRKYLSFLRAAFFFLFTFGFLSAQHSGEEEEANRRHYVCAMAQQMAFHSHSLVVFEALI